MKRYSTHLMTAGTYVLSLLYNQLLVFPHTTLSFCDILGAVLLSLAHTRYDDIITQFICENIYYLS